MKNADTIAAIATPSGEGGVGIIRISGQGVLDVAEKVFVPRGRGGWPPRHRHLVYGDVQGPGGPIDHGFLVYMKGPHTYTGEDLVELQLHGSTIVLQQALDAVFAAGARPAGPGEFTRRAFLAGRLDLTQAEAVMDVISAATPQGLASARARLCGNLARRAEEISGLLTALITRLEAGLEFPEDMEAEAEIAPPSGLAREGREIEELTSHVASLLDSYRQGSALRRGVRVLILGRPNVGKSSLLNLLLGEERAIVTHVPGTTRDVIEETINMHGLAVRLMDTAGLRETADFVESLGVRAARDRIAQADLVLFVVDASSIDPAADGEILRGLEDRRVIIVANKCDLLGRTDKEAVGKKLSAMSTAPVVLVSALENWGLQDLEAAIFRSVTGRSPGQGLDEGEVLVATERQREALQRVLSGLERAGGALSGGMPQDLVAEDLRTALEGLKELTGEVTTEDILDRIFSKFCIGK